MLPKKLEWSVLAQCDYFAVEKFVQTPDRPAMTPIQPLRECIFLRKIKSDLKWKETFEILCQSYKDLAPTFAIEHDNFGGYRLVYRGKSVVHPPEIFKRKPSGFVAPVPFGAMTNLSVMSSERTGQQLLLLGPIRFVNSNCEPNCEYDFSSDSGIVQLRIKKKIYPGDEILVKYGPEFFEENECLCCTCRLKERRNAECDCIFELLLQNLLDDLANEVLVDLEGEQSSSHCSPCPPKKQKLRGRKLIEKVNELTSSPLSIYGSPELPNLSANIQTVGNDFESEQTTESSISQLETTSSERTSLDSHAAAENVFDSPRENFTPSSENSLSDKPSVSDRVISPEINAAVSDRGISPETNASVSDPDISPEINDITAHKISARLFEGSTICVDDVTVLMNAFCSRFSLSDECSTKMHALIKAFLPQGNNFPTGYSQIRRAKKLFEEDVRFLKKSPRQSLCVTGFRFELRDIVQRNFNDIIEYSDQRKESPHLDCNTFVCPPVDLNDDRKVFINLLLFSDGVNIKKSTLRKELWPVWFQVADLPPRKRMSRQNIVLGALFNGNTTPNWNELVPIINSELLSGVNFKHNGVSFQAFFSIKLLIADLGAKSHMLNMFKFNGFYGCHYCTAPGKTIGKTHAYYPFAQIGKIREPDINNVFVKYAELVPVDELINVAGVKGKSAFSSVINNLPLAAPIDYMHCVLLGVFSRSSEIMLQSPVI